MNEWIIKHFYKSKAVHCVVFDNTRRMKHYYTIPRSNDIVTINGRSYFVNPKEYFLDKKGFPTYVFNTNNIDPVDVSKPLDPLYDNKNIISPDDLNLAISSHVARDIFDATNGKTDFNVITTILTIVCIIGLIVLAYFGSEQIKIILDKIAEIREALRQIGGV